MGLLVCSGWLLGSCLLGLTSLYDNLVSTYTTDQCLGFLNKLIVLLSKDVLN